MIKKNRTLASWILIFVILAVILTGCAGSAPAQTGGQEGTTATATETDSNAEGTTMKELTGDKNSVLELGQSMPTGDLGRITKVNKLEKYTEEDAEKADRAMRAYTPSVSEGLLINNSPHFYYYEQLSGDIKSFYEVMEMISHDPVSADYVVSLKLNRPITQEEFDKYYYTAYQALCFDHPELFWLYNYSRTSITAGSLDGQEIYFTFAKPYPEFENDMKAFNEAAQSILSKVDHNASQVDQAKQIHDMICEMVTYDYQVLELGQTKEGFTDLAHTAYGVLVSNSRGDKNTAVCDGYSLAYQYLLSQCGIEAVLIPGKAGNDQASMGGHAWNVAKLDGDWYEIDTTWDDNMTELKEKLDPSVDGYNYFMEALNDPEYSAHLAHYLYGIDTSGIKNYTPKEADYYTTKDGMYQICLTGVSYHYRANEFTDMQGDGDLAALAPQAFKTLY